MLQMVQNSTVIIKEKDTLILPHLPRPTASRILHYTFKAIHSLAPSLSIKTSSAPKHTLMKKIAIQKVITLDRYNIGNIALDEH